MNRRDRPNADWAFLRRVMQVREQEREALVKDADLRAPPVHAEGHEQKPERNARIRELAAQGKTDREIALELGQPYKTIAVARGRLGIPVNAIPVAQRTARAREGKVLSTQTYNRMRALIECGWTDHAIARETGAPVEAIAKCRARMERKAVGQ